MLRISSLLSLAFCAGLVAYSGALGGCGEDTGGARDADTEEDAASRAKPDSARPVEPPPRACAGRFIEEVEAIEPATDACSYDGDPELEEIARAACRGVQYLLQNEDARGGSALILVDMIARRFRIESLLALWDLEEQMNDEAQSLDDRIFTRLAGAQITATAAELESLESPIDRFTSVAIFCRELGFPEDYLDILRVNNALGGYEATHVLLAFFWLEERGCSLLGSEEIRSDALAITASLIDADHDDVRDLELEAAAFLAYEGALDLIPEGFLEGAIMAQAESGGFADGSESDVILHASVLGVWYLHELLYPDRRTPLVNPCAR